MVPQKNINRDEITIEPISIVDDIGILFTWENRLFRAIKHEYVEHVKNLFNCGLLKELIENNLFPETWITDFSVKGFGLIVEHKKIEHVTYPFEWSFSMLKDAGIAVLKVNEIAKKYGYQTKDCHSFNIVFDGLIPKFVDLGSFIKRDNESKGWIAYKQFLESYYFPLKIWSNGNSFIARSIIANESEFITFYEYLLYKSFIFRLFPLDLLKKLTFVFFKYKRISSFSKSNLIKAKRGLLVKIVLFLKRMHMLPLNSINFNSLINKLNKIHKRRTNSRWGTYHNEFYSIDGKLLSTPRFDRIMKIIKSYDIKNIVELGGNQGVLSRLLLELNIVEHAICTDYDENAIDQMYLSCKKNGINSITPVLLNFVLPVTVSKATPANKRFQSELVIALALTHHLLLSQKLRIDFVFNEIAKYSIKYVMIEFMPLGLWDGNNNYDVPEWYNIEWFRKSFQGFFKIILEEQLEKNRILFFGEKI